MSVSILVLSAAITVVFTRGSIFQFLRGPMQRAREAESRITRFFRDLFSCPLCSGVWIGMAASLLHDSAGRWDVIRAIDLLGFGCVSAVLALTAYSALDWLQAPHWEMPAMGQVQPVQPIVMSVPMPTAPPNHEEHRVRRPPTPQNPSQITGG